MGLQGRQERDEGLELELVREVVLARRRQDSVVLAALTLGAELLDHSGTTTARRAAQILHAHRVDEQAVARDPHAALQADVAHDRRRIHRLGLGHESAERDPARERRRLQTALLCEVRADLLAVVSRCRHMRFDRLAFSDGIAEGLAAAAGKLENVADQDVYRAWQRGMVLKLDEIACPEGPPRVLATVDAGPGLEPLVVEWDSCERRLALLARMQRAGVTPVEICDRLLTDLSMSSPLRYSVR